MTNKELLEKEGIYFAQEIVGGIPCSIGYLKKFRKRWFFTQLNLFIMIGETNTTVERRALERFSNASYNYALKNYRGWKRGWQGAVGSIAILKAENMKPEAVKFCLRPGKMHYSAFEVPVLYDTKNKVCIRFKGRPFWGALYYSFFAKTIDRIAELLNEQSNLNQIPTQTE